MLEPRVARLEADVAELKADVKELRVLVAALPTRTDQRNYTMAMVGISVASVIAVGFGVGAPVQGSVATAQAGMANQLAAFQAGLSAIQAAAQREARAPIIIQVPPAPTAPIPVPR
jgi:hypothetical protein